MRLALKSLITALVCVLSCPLVLAGEKEPQAAKISWETDYRQAMGLANKQRKMLLIFFHDPKDLQSDRLDRETFANPDLQQKLQDLICLRVPLDAKITLDQKEVVLLKHPSLSEMLGRPGVAIADFSSADPNLHGYIVSVFPLSNGLFYGPAEMKTILDLPPGTL